MMELRHSGTSGGLRNVPRRLVPDRLRHQTPSRRFMNRIQSIELLDQPSSSFIKASYCFSGSRACLAMQMPRFFLRSFTRSGLRHPTTRTFSSFVVPGNRSAPWLKERVFTAITRAQRHKTIARPFSTSPAFRQEPNTSASEPENARREDVPSYEMRFTCKKCMTPQTHKISKQGYHHGTVLVTCPGCKNRHLVADHLKVIAFAIVAQPVMTDYSKDILRQERYFGRYFER